MSIRHIGRFLLYLNSIKQTKHSTQGGNCMKIISSNTLSAIQKDEIIALQTACNNFENLNNEAFLSNEINYNKELPCFFLAYEDNRLIAFLTTFMPQSNEAEILGFTHPSYRNQSYFTALLSSAKQMMKTTEISNILFCVEPHCKSASEFLKSFQPIPLERSEYRLVHSGITNPPESPDLLTQLVNQHNKDICLELTDAIFLMGKGENDNFIENAVQSPSRDAYLAFWKNEPIGTFNLNYEDNTAFLYGFGIHPSFQHKGYGKQLLELALNLAFEKSNQVILDVDSSNQSAYNLYIHNGFSVDFQVDYYLCHL